jgi:hypothetical protein
VNVPLHAGRSFDELPHESARQISEGGQATVSLVPSPDGGDEIIVKQFRMAPDVDRALNEEVAALRRLRGLVHGSTFAGWTIHIPAVVAISQHPPSLALTRIPGTPIDTLIQDGWVPPADLGAALAEVFRQYWQSSGRPLGDVNLSNLMCSPDTRQLGIIDPGLPSDAFELRGQARRFYPASRDLGCLVHQVLSTNVSLHLTRRTSAADRLDFVRHVIRLCVATEQDAQAFVAEIGACAAAHLARVSGGGLFQSVWRLAVRGIAQRALSEELLLLSEAPSCR